MRLNAAQERLQKSAVITTARNSVYKAVFQIAHIVTVNDITKLVTKGTTPKTYGFEFVDKGVPFLRAEEVVDGEVLYKNTPFYIDEKTNDFMGRSRTYSGDVLITIAGSIGRAAVVPKSAPELNMNQAVALVRCNEYINPYYLYHMIQSHAVQEQISGSTVTSAISNLSLGKIKEIKIPVPSRSEQDIIAKFLEAIRKQERWDNYSSSLPDYLKHIPRIVVRVEELVGKVEEVRSLRQKALEESEALTKAAMRQIFKPHENYQEVSLESVCAAIIDNLHSNPVYSDNGVPCIRSSDVGWGALYLHTARCTSEEEYKRRTVRGEPIPNDIVLVREGGGTGKAAIVLEGQRFSLGQRVMMLRPDKNKVIPKFFLYQILSPSVYEDQIIPRCKGSASPHLNIGALRKFNFFLPPLPKQHRIVNYLDELQTKVDTIKRQREQAMKELNALLPSILDKAFKGEL